MKVIDAHSRLRIRLLSMTLAAVVPGLLCGLLAGTDRATAVPAFAVQTNQPCAACHVGAFGPQLKQYGRDFKLFGYVSSQGKHDLPPLAITSQTSFTHTQAAQPGGAAPHFGPNDNVSEDQISLYYAGRITAHSGAFAQLTYDGVARQLHWDNLDIRYARDDADWVDDDFVWGIDANNSPTVQDLWNSTPTWGFPYISSALAQGPGSQTLIDGALGEEVVGITGYAQYQAFLYIEGGAYKGLGRDVRNAFGITPVTLSDSVDGVIPYWRLALQHEFEEGRQYAQIGTYGLAASIYPQGFKSSGTDRRTDIAFDANYQFVADPKSVVSDVVSAHATFIRETLNLNASSQLFGTKRSDHLNTFRTDVSYSIDATWTPSVQYFRNNGSTDAIEFGTASGSPDSAGFVAEIAYVPWGKPDSPVNWANARLSLQYVAFTRFDGISARASDNNVIFVNLWLALAGNR